MSPRAASRLEELGFTRVFDYAAGKADWGSFGLPLEGRADSSTRVGAIARLDAPTCRTDELVANVAERIEDSWDLCVVVDGSVVAGLLGRDALSARDRVPAKEAMTLGPRTIRPSARREAIAQRMRDQDLRHLLVTLSNGFFVGVARREDFE